MSVFCTDPRSEFGGKTIAAMLVCGIVKRKKKKKGGGGPPELYFNQIKVMIRVGTISLLGFYLIYDWRLMEMCITECTTVFVCAVYLSLIHI